MKAPQLNRELELQDPVPSADGAGGFALSWDTLAQLWAEIRPGSGRDLAGEERMESAVPYRITVRAAELGSAARPKPGQRFAEGARVFAILAVTERDPMGRYLTCFCREEGPR